MPELAERIYKELGREIGTRGDLTMFARHFRTDEMEVEQALHLLVIQGRASHRPSFFEPTMQAWYRT
jgi:hypothetical protein